MPKTDSTVSPRNIIDGDKTLLSYPFKIYLPIFASFCDILKETAPPLAATAFYYAYENEALNLKIICEFLTAYKNELPALFKQHRPIHLKKQYLLCDNLTQFKDPQWKEIIEALYNKDKNPIIIVTANRQHQLVIDCLGVILPAKSFEVLYADPGFVKKENRRSVNLLWGHKLLIPENSDEKYITRLKKRLVNTGFFDCMPVSPVLELKTMSSSKSFLYEQTSSYSPGHWQPIKEVEERKSDSPLHRLVDSGEYKHTPPQYN